MAGELFSEVAFDHNQPADPLFLWGAARSGTNLVCWNLELSSDIECFNEDNPAAFQGFFLKSNDTLSELLLKRSKSKVFFKCFSDTPRARDLMSYFRASRAVYLVRNPTDTIASFVQAFDRDCHIWKHRFACAARGDVGPLLALAGSNRDLHDRIQATAAEAISRLRRHGSTLHNIAAAYYIWQHSFYFRLGSCASRVLVVDYDKLTCYPTETIRRITDWFGVRPLEFNTDTIHRGRGARSMNGSASTEMLSECMDIFDAITASSGTAQKT